MGTSKYNLPKIDGMASVKIPRDFNALADAVDRIVSSEIYRLDTVAASIASGSPKALYPTVSALQTAKPMGDSNIYIVSADGKWYYWNGTNWTAGGVYQSTGLSDNSVTYRKIKKSIDNELSEDLSLAVRVPDKYVHATTGVLTNYPNTTTGGVTDFIAVTPGEVLQYFGYSSGVGLAGWIYNSAKQPLVALTSPATNNALATMTMPTNAAYVRVNYAYASVASFSVKRFQLEKGGLDWLEVKKENLLDSIVEEKHLTSEVKEKLNIKDASVGIEKLKPETVTALRTTQVENGSVTLDKLSQSVLDYIAEPSSAPINPFDGNNSTWVGDSITQGTGTTSTTKRFSNIVANKLSFSLSGYQNLGVGGSTIARPPSGTIKSFVQRVCDENHITTNRHRIFVLGGVNDFGQNVPLSSQDAALSYFATNATWNDSTFYGALHRIITYIRENHNDAELVFITPMHYALENTPNGQGAKMLAYVNAVKEVCTFYAVPYIDLWSELPIDPKNTGHKNKYTMNGNLTAPDGIHPNDVGNAMIAKKVINFLKYQYIV